MSQNSESILGKKSLIQKALLLNSMTIMIFSFNGFFTGENYLYRIAIWVTITFGLFGYGLFIKLFNLKVLFAYIMIVISLVGYNYYLLSKIKI